MRKKPMKIKFREAFKFIRKIPNWPKYVLIIFLIFALLGIANDYFKTRKRLLSLKKDYHQLSENLAASESKFATLSDLKKNLEASLSERDKAIEFFKKENLKLRSVGITEGHLDGSEGTTPVELGKEKYSELLAFANGLPIARTEFNIKDYQWNNRVFGLDFEVNTIIATDADGLDQVITELKAYNNELEETKGQAYPIKITSSSFEQVLPTQKIFHFINPKLDIALSGGASWQRLDINPSVTPELGISLMGYGITPDAEIWRFLRLGAGYDAYNKSARGSVGLAGYNLGDSLPLIDDLWFWPAYTIDHKGNSGFSISIGTNL
jgi:hypothetical protein